MAIKDLSSHARKIRKWFQNQPSQIYHEETIQDACKLRLGELLTALGELQREGLIQPQSLDRWEYIGAK